MRTCSHHPSTTTAQVQDSRSPYLFHLSDQEPSPYILPEPEFFTSEAYNQSNGGGKDLKKGQTQCMT